MGKTGVESLSVQQERCLRLVGEGFTSLEISGQLGISDKTVNRHVEMAAQKLGARNRAHAARILREHDRSLGAAEAGDKPPTDILRVASGPFGGSSSGSTEMSVRDSHASRFQTEMEFAHPDLSASRGGKDREPTNHLKTVLLIVAIAVGIAILIIAFPSLMRNSTDLANDIQPYHHKRN
jgi:DNA-binding CsgD family transcriptional regulator